MKEVNCVYTHNNSRHKPFHRYWSTPFLIINVVYMSIHDFEQTICSMGRNGLSGFILFVKSFPVLNSYELMFVAERKKEMLDKAVRHQNIAF